MYWGFICPICFIRNDYWSKETVVGGDYNIPYPFIKKKVPCDECHFLYAYIDLSGIGNIISLINEKNVLIEEVDIFCSTIVRDVNEKMGNRSSAIFFINDVPILETLESLLNPTILENIAMKKHFLLSQTDESFNYKLFCPNCIRKKIFSKNSERKTLQDILNDIGRTVTFSNSSSGYLCTKCSEKANYYELYTSSTLFEQIVFGNVSMHSLSSYCYSFILELIENPISFFEKHYKSMFLSFIRSKRKLTLLLTKDASLKEKITEQLKFLDKTRLDQEN